MSEAILPAQAIVQTSHQEKEWLPAKVIYTILMALALLSHIWLMVIGAGIDNIPTYIWILRLLPVPFAICLGKLWKDRGFQILSLYFLLFYFRCFIPNPGSIFSVEMSESILSALWLFAGCYGLGIILNNKQFKRFLVVCSTIWTTIIAVLCCLGIYAIWTEQPIVLLDNGIIRANTGYGFARLELIYVSTASGAIMSITILIGMILILCLKRTIHKTIILLMLIPIIFAIALTDSRTAFISTATGLAIIVFCRLLYRDKRETNKKEKRKAWLFGTVAMIIVFILVVLIFLQITPIFNRLRMQGFISNALAEETQKSVVLSRGFEGSQMLTDRTRIWSSIIEEIKQNKEVLLTGESKQISTAVFGQRYGHGYGHSHCIYLQILLESGIPGLTLVLLFIGYIIKKSILSFTQTDLPLWIRLLPAIPISLWVADLVECFTWLRSSYCPMTTVLFITAGILSKQVIPTKTKQTKG